MTVMDWISAEKSLQQFIKQDLPFLIKPHFNDTLNIIVAYLQSFDISLDLVLEKYPNFIETLHLQIYLYFADRMGQNHLNSNSDFYHDYCSLAVNYQSEFIYYIVESQIKSSYIQDVINRQRYIEIINF